MKKLWSVLLLVVFLLSSSTIVFAEADQGQTGLAEIKTTIGVEKTIAQTFPDPNLAQLIADDVAGGNVNTVLTQSMIDGIISINGDHGNIKNIQGIENLTSLESLFLNHNQITSLPESIGNLTNLKYLNISYNQITTLPESIGNLINLNQLHMSTNKIVSLPDSIGNLTKLTYLSVYDNQLTYLPESIGNLVNLNFFFIIENQLTNLPKSISNLTALPSLYLAYNLFPTNYPSELDVAGLNFSIDYGEQRKLRLKPNAEKVYTIQSGADFTGLDLGGITEVSRIGISMDLSPSHSLVLVNYADENNMPVSIDAYLKNGIVQKSGKVYAQIRAEGTGMLPNTSDNAVTSEKIELNFIKNENIAPVDPAQKDNNQVESTITTLASNSNANPKTGDNNQLIALSIGLLSSMVLLGALLRKKRAL